MAELKINNLAKHNCRLIAVASQVLKENVYEIDSIIFENEKYTVIDMFTWNTQEEIFPQGLFLLSTGEILEEEKVRRAYNYSKYIYFFVCEL